jgi:D-psicose/D-tagatose/L-ribulose 3-epimerase
MVMKFGANTQIWAAPFKATDMGLIEKVAKMGFDLIELGVASEDPPFDAKQVRRRLQDAGLQSCVCSFIPADRDIASADSAIRRRGVEYLKSLVATTAALGGSVLCGPLYAELFRARYLPLAQRSQEWEWSVTGLRQAASAAADEGVTIALECLNRFETDLINLAEQAVRMVEEVGSPALGVHLDTFHMSIEEKDQGRAIRETGKYLKHFHACENDRGTPGSGQVRWDTVRDALRDIRYEGYVAIEGFNPEIVDLANGARIWRPMASTPDALARVGLKFLTNLFS